MPIILNTDFTKSAGDKIHFQTMRRLMHSGVTGNTVLAGSEEKLSLGQFDLEVEWLRHAVAFNKRGTKRANFDAVMVAGEELASWLARAMDDSMFKQMLSTETPTTLYSGGKTSEAGLTSTDVFNTDSLDRAKLALLRKGSIPFQVKSVGGTTLKFFGIVIDAVDAYNLRGDEAWFAAQRDANLRGLDNPIFSGALGIYNGMIIYEFSNVSGVQGTWLRPEATLAAAVANAGAIAVTTTINSDSDIDANKYFPTTGTIRIDAEDMVYTSKANNTFTVAAGGRGANGTVAAVHNANAIITLRNITKQIGFGAECAVRGWGLYPRKTRDVQDYGFKFGVGIEAVYGQKCIVDVAGVLQNFIMMKSYAANPNSTI
jgi:N4-gp56 family major capsid protein